MNDLKRDSSRVTDEENLTSHQDEQAEEDHLLRMRRSLSTRSLDFISSSPRLSRVWNFLPLICLVVAALSWLGGSVNAAFVIATLGVLAWFINVRNQLQKTGAKRE